jgi:hypothetical protein
VRQFTGLFGGAAVGFTAGLILQWAIGLTRITGHADNPFSVIFGLPVAMAIAFGLFGLLLATTREVAVVDAPVRVRWFRGLGRAATSTRGQLPGSSVPPGTTGDEERPAGSGPPRAGIGA